MYALAREVLAISRQSARVVKQNGGDAEDERSIEDIVCHDPRAVLIALVNHWGLMNAVAPSAEEALRAYAMRATIKVYAPVAGQLGLRDLKHDLYGLAVRLTNPAEYGQLERWVSLMKERCRSIVEEEKTNIESSLQEARIDAKVEITDRNIYSLYRKMREGVEFVAPYRLRIITPDMSTTRAIQQHLDTLWPEGAMIDYINEPKESGYKSIHKTIYSKCFEMSVQIRTQEMHNLAVQGVFSLLPIEPASESSSIAAYVQGVQQVRSDPLLRADVERYLSAIKGDDPKTDVSQSSLLYVRTRDGLLRGIPSPATALDFAYSIHTEIGHRAIAAFINGRPQLLDYALHTGEHVQIVYGRRLTVRPEWLGDTFTYTERAKRCIHDYLGGPLSNLSVSPLRSRVVELVAENDPQLLQDICNTANKYRLKIKFIKREREHASNRTNTMLCVSSTSDKHLTEFAQGIEERTRRCEGVNWYK